MYFVIDDLFILHTSPIKMVATRSSNSSTAETGEKRSAPSAPSAASGRSSKKAKKEDGKLEVGKDGQVGLKEEPNHQDDNAQEPADDASKEGGENHTKTTNTEPKRNLDHRKEGVKEAPDHRDEKEQDGTNDRPNGEKNDGKQTEAKPKAGEDMQQTREEMKEEEGKKAEKGEDEVDGNALQGTKEELEEPKHGKYSTIPCTRDAGADIQEHWRVDISTSFTAPKSTTATM